MKNFTINLHDEVQLSPSGDWIVNSSTVPAAFLLSTEAILGSVPDSLN